MLQKKTKAENIQVDPKVETKKETFEVGAGEAVLVNGGEWVRYSSPDPGGAEYIAVCMPAFSPDTVHRDE